MKAREEKTVIEQRYFEREEKRPLKKVMAIVVHWPGGDYVPYLDSLWKWMNEESDKSYHYFINKDRIIHIRDEHKYRAIHCGHKTYKKGAVEFFGTDICSSYNSPNNYTIGVCMLHDYKDGSYMTPTMQSAIELIGNLCMEYDLDPQVALFRHSDITGEKRTPCPKGFYEDDDDPHDLWRSFKQWVSDYMRDKTAELLGLKGHII